MLKDEEGEATIVCGVLNRQAFIRWLLHFMPNRGWLFIFGYCPRLNACLDTGHLLFRYALASCWRVNARVRKLSCGEVYLSEIKAPYHVSMRSLHAMNLHLNKAVSLAREED
jgi:hypothetical protein